MVLFNSSKTFELFYSIEVFFYAKQAFKPILVTYTDITWLFMSMMDSMIITTASTSNSNRFKISVSTLQWACNAYNITIAAVLLVGVAFGERFGRRKIYNLGIGIFTLGSLLCALSPNITSLVMLSCRRNRCIRHDTDVNGHFN